MSASLAGSERESAPLLAPELGLRHRLVDTHAIRCAGYQDAWPGLRDNARNAAAL